MRIDLRGAVAGTAVATLLSAGVVLGSRGLRDYDRALLPYTLGVLFAAFAIAYRVAVWLQRPPTAVYWRRGWQILFRRGERLGNLAFLARAAFGGFLAQRFVHRRGPRRWLAHFSLAWGSLLAAAVTFPLVFGWLHFETRPGDARWYQVVVLGRVMAEFHTDSLARYVLFNLLNLSAVMVIGGCLLALYRRLRDPGERARQQFGHDIAPLLLLIAISATGLMLTFSTHLLGGAGYRVISLVHAVVVTGTLLYIPFGKLFHVFQRPAHLSVALYRRAGAAAPAALCDCCGESFASAMHVADLEGVLAGVDFDGTLEGPVRHYTGVCPRCRRRLFGFTQGRLLDRTGSA